MNTILKIENLKKFYASDCVLDIENLEIKESSIYGLIGPNGAGKSTLMKLILGLVKKDFGKIFLFGKELNEKNQKEFNRVLGALIENPSFYEHLTGYENLEIICMLKNISKNEITRTLELVGLTNAANKKAKEYSLGMKQRLGIGIALIGHPKMLILDEPINGLDPQGIEEMRNLFNNIVTNSSTSILISSHILDEIEKISTHIGILKSGKLIYNGKLSDYRMIHPPFISIETSDNIKTASLLNLSQKNVKNKKLILGKKSNDEIGKIVHYLHGKVDIYRIEEERESLEKLFIAETKRVK